LFRWALTALSFPSPLSFHSKRTAARAKDEPGIHQIEIALAILGKRDE